MASPQNFVQVDSVQSFEKVLGSSGKQLVVAFFSASWSEECNQMKDVVTELAKDLIHSKFVQIEAEEVPELSEQYSVAFVPVFVLIKNQKEVGRVEGANAPSLTKAIQHHATSFVAPVVNERIETAPEDLNTRLKNLISSAPCMLFMKGSPTEPRCGFSRQIVDIFAKYNVKYSHFDILADDYVRQGLKTYSNWPTFPQLYSNGDLIGGLDIVRELAENGELDQMLPKSEDLDTRLGKLIHRAPIMLFMKGDPQGPQCKFSRAVVQILSTVNAKYDHFDILSDNEVREGLKKYSNWPTYPQLYVNGELVGGLDILKELQESGELEATLAV
ncbi:glutaredoxin-3-like [Rhopilema esculentum]|uniref:glutaredoxin-3-like n=1 Tax=Rhopilema esculentum TaxID=499914 RepID=UPI0031D24608|eukprot:gene12336-2987_t